MGSSMRSGVWLAPLLVLAGCSGSGGTSGDPSATGPDIADDPGSFDDIAGDATETTGIILGVVVDERIVPIEGAEITVAGGTLEPKSTTSDALGRFTFSDLLAGDYFLTGKAALHKEIQTSVTVVAGVNDPEVVKLALPRIYQQDPFHVPIEREGYFDCSQALGLVVVWYSSSNCVADPCPIYKNYVDQLQCNDYPTRGLNNVTNQEREWHMDVEAGWQQIVFEQTWTPSAQGTTPRMGMTVSTYKPERNPLHFFASVASGNPMRFQFDVGVTHDTAQTPDGTLEQIPAEGLQRVSYFSSARGGGATEPGLALQQKFNVYIHQFYYGVPKEGWSFVAGDKPPF